MGFCVFLFPRIARFLYGKKISSFYCIYTIGVIGFFYDTL